MTSYTNVVPSPQDLMTCPYNPAHQIHHYRMQVHLEKCRKQHPNANKEKCPLNSKHIVNSQEMNFHMVICESRKLLDTQVYAVDNGLEFMCDVEEVPDLRSSENWDDGFTSYQPPPRASHVLHKIKGATPAERRKFRSECVRNFKPKE